MRTTIAFLKVFFLAACSLAHCQCVEINKNHASEDNNTPKKIFCSDSDGVRLPEKEYKDLTCDSTTSAILKADQDAANRTLKNYLMTLQEPCDEEAFYDSGPCKKLLINFTPKGQASDFSKGQRILLMDGGLVLLSMLRYHERVLDILDFSHPNGELATTKRKVITTEATKHVFYDLIGTQYKHLPAALFQPVAGRGVGDLKILRAYTSILSDGSSEIKEMMGAGHGVLILNKLMDYNPHAEFVIVDNQNGKEILDKANIDFCQSHIDSAVLVKYEDHVRQKTKVIIDAIEKFDINFISSSNSHSVINWERFLSHYCGLDFPTKEMAKKFYNIDTLRFVDPLNKLPEIIVVQAVNNAVDFTTEQARNDNNDCKRFQNRIRVGVFGMSNSGLSIDGVNDINVIPRDAHSFIPCIDMVVNVGRSKGANDSFAPMVVWDDCNQNTACCTQWTPYFGVGTGGRLNEMTFSTSFAVPVALSYLIYLKFCKLARKAVL